MMTETTERLCTLIPLGGQIIIKRDPPKLKTKGGILLPGAGGTAKQVCTGVVIRKGPGHVAPHTGERIVISDTILPGAHVMFMQHAGGDYPHEEAHGKETYTLMQEAEIVCVIGGPADGVTIPEGVISQTELEKAQTAEQDATLKAVNARRKQVEAQAARVANQLSGRSGGGIVRPR